MSLIWLFIRTLTAQDTVTFQKLVPQAYTPILRRYTWEGVGWHQKIAPWSYVECHVELRDVWLLRMKGFKPGSGCFGGAIHIRKGELRATGVHIYECNSVCGGGIFVMSSTCILTEMNITNTNATQQGGGLAVTREIGDTSELFCVLIDSIFDYCKAGGDGGGMVATDISEVVIQNSQFSSCDAKGGGGGLTASNSQVYLNSVFMHLNSAGSSSLQLSIHGKSASPHDRGGGAIWFIGNEECVMMSEACCFIGNKCVVPTTTIPGTGFDVKVSGEAAKYCSYGDRFWNLEHVSVKCSLFIHQTTRWYGNYEKFVGALSGACTDYIAYLDEELIVEAPEYSVDLGNVKPDSHLGVYTDIVEISVPANTIGRTQVPRATDNGRTLIQTQVMVFTMSRVTYKLITSFTPTAYFTRSSYFTNTNGFTGSEPFTDSHELTLSDAFSTSAAFSASSAFTKSVSFTATSTFTSSEPFSNSRIFSHSDAFNPTATFSPVMTRTPHPEYLSIVQSFVGSTTISASVTVSEVYSYVQEHVEITSTDADGKVIVVETIIERKVLSLAAVTIPVYVVTQSQVEFLIARSNEPPLGMSSTLFIGMITGVGLTALFIGYIVAWFIRHRNDNSTISQSDYSSDSDRYANDELVENNVHDLVNLWEDGDDGDEWLNN